MKNWMKIGCCLLPLIVLFGNSRAPKQNWTHFVRTAGHGLRLDNVDDIIRSATETHVFGIETDNDIPGRYESFLDPDEKLRAIKAMADQAHEAGNFAYVYIAGLECITAHADASPRSFFKDHPDWVQRDITGRPAMFGAESAFWIAEGDEDVWISPFALEWRKIFMKRVRQIATTGIDGVYVDIPYWMTHFDGWEDTWASFDDYTVKAFLNATGLNAKTDIRLGDFSDPGFRIWIDFRIQTLTEFMAEIDENVKSVNPACMTIAEIYPGIGEDAVRVGADVYDMYQVVDVIAHEFSAGGYTAAARNPLAWFEYMIGMYTFRAFAEGKASWMLSYSWDGEENIQPADAMKNLFVSQLMAGTNPWDARGHVMSGSNDFETRKEVYSWLAKHEKTFYHPRQPLKETIGLYFSPSTRNYYTNDYMDSYKGFFHLLLHSHLPFQVVTPRTLSAFRGEILIMPDVRCLAADERNTIQDLVNRGMRLVVSGQFDCCNETGAPRTVEEKTSFLTAISDKDEDRWMHWLPKHCPGKQYLKSVRTTFDEAARVGRTDRLPFSSKIKSFQKKMGDMGYSSSIELEGSPFMSAQLVRVDGKLHVFIVNFKGLAGNKNVGQLAEHDVVLRLKTNNNLVVKILPFMGEVENVPTQWKNGILTCTLPPIIKGAVVWVDIVDE